MASGSKITDIGVSTLTEFLNSAHGVCLQELNLEHNDITAAGISKFCEVLRNDHEVVSRFVVLNLQPRPRRFKTLARSRDTRVKRRGRGCSILVLIILVMMACACYVDH